MSHFTVGIIFTPAGFTNLDETIDEMMSPYDENISVAPYPCYSVEQARIDLERDRRHLARLLTEDNPRFDRQRCQDELERLRHVTPEEKYAEFAQAHYHFNSQGEPISSYNPRAKWDWYEIGGRWHGWLYQDTPVSPDADPNVATTQHVLAHEKVPFALITPDGHWHERGAMGWFGLFFSDKDEDQWHSEARHLLQSYPQHRIVIIDAHI